MRSFFMLFTLIAVAPIFSKQLLLDEVMNKEDQKKSGVAYLTPNQRSVLESWINKNCNCVTNNPTQDKDPTNLSLSINIENGKKIQLSDGSLWEIDPKDYANSQTWLSPFPIKIVPSNDRDFPSLLVNKNTGNSIKAKKIDPSSTTPSQTLNPPAQKPITPPSAQPTQKK